MPNPGRNRPEMGIDQHKADCLARWQALEAEARNKWRMHKAGRLTKAQLHEWLSTLDKMDRRTIKRMYAASGRKSHDSK